MRGQRDFLRFFDREVELASFSFEARDKGLWIGHSRQEEEGYLWTVLSEGLFASSSPAWRGVAASSDCPGDGRQECGPVLGPKMKGGDPVSSTLSPLDPAGPPRTLTPSNEEEEPLAQAIGGVGHDDGRVQVAALHEHPEEVSHHEVVEAGGDAAAPDLRGASSSQWLPGAQAQVHSLGADGGEVV